MSALNLATPLTVSPDMPISDVLELIHKEGYDQVPVIDDDGLVASTESTTLLHLMQHSSRCLVVL